MESVVNHTRNIGFMRLRDVLQIIPVSRSKWWEGVKAGYYPSAVKLSPRTSAWPKQDIIDLAERLKNGDVSFIVQDDDANERGATH